MKKLLLFLLIFSGIRFANAQCLTCKQGQHVPGDPTIQHTPNGNQALGQSYIQQNICGLTYAIGSVLIETRSANYSFNDSGTGFPAPINMVGVCGISSPQKAYVYYDASYTEATPPATTVTIKNPNNVSATYPSVLIGTGPSKCWGENGTAVYRADVTAAITGNGGYSLTSINGFNNAAYEVDGATLIIIYTTSATWSGSIALWDGCWTLIGGTANYTGTGFSACAATNTVSAFAGYGDMQDNVNGGLNTETFGGVTKTFWNTFWNCNSINCSMSSGQSSFNFDSYTNNGGDCWTWAFAGLYWQNTNCVTCAPHSLSYTNTIVNPTCGQNNGSISVGVTGGILPYTYNWSPNVSTTASATGLSVGVYVISITDSTGCNSVIDTVKLVNPTAPNLSVSTVNVTCYGQGGGQATVTATGGTPGYTYLWTPGNQTTQTITGLSAGSYTILVTDAAGCQSVDIAYVTQPPPFSVMIDSVHGLQCSNSGNIGAIWVNGSGGTPGYQYLWSPGGQTTSSITGLSQGTYTVQVTDANGCIHDTSVLITVVSPITMTLASFDSYCGQPNGFAYVSTISGGTQPYTYMWTNGCPFSFNFGLSAGQYCCTVTDANGCTDSACCQVGNSAPFNITLTATPLACHGGNNATATATVTGGGFPWTYLWTPSSQTNPTATGLSAATYTCTVTDNSGCSSSAIITITQPPPIYLTVGPQPDTICIGQSATFSVVADSGTPPYNFVWSTGATGTSCTVNPAVTTTYSVKVTDANGCTDSVQNIKLVVRPALRVSINPTSAASCPGVSKTFTATATGGDGTYQYVWTPGNTTGTSVTVTPTVTTTYTVTVTDGCGTPPATAVVRYTIYPLPVPGFKSDSLVGCSPLCVTITDTSRIAGGTITKWNWNFGDGSPADTLQNPKHCYLTAGKYTLIETLTSNNGCTSSDTVTNYLTVYHHPHAQFVLSPQPTTIIQPTITFTDQSTDSYGSITSWLWTFGDNLDSIVTHQDAVHTYADTGTFCATLRVTNMYGCIDSVTNCLVIDPQFTLYIPSGFSPGGLNHLNSIFMPKGEAMKSFDMWIFDRWGMLLFHSNNIMYGWDGTVNGVLAQEDTYVYLINVIDNFNKKHSYIGNISMVR